MHLLIFLGAKSFKVNRHLMVFHRLSGHTKAHRQETMAIAAGQMGLILLLGRRIHGKKDIAIIPPIPIPQPINNTPIQSNLDHRSPQKILRSLRNPRANVQDSPNLVVTKKMVSTATVCRRRAYLILLIRQGTSNLVQYSCIHRKELLRRVFDATKSRESVTTLDQGVQDAAGPTLRAFLS